MDSFSIVFVCTGNRFRSPLAEALVRQLTLGQSVSATSYGVLDLEESPALPEAVALARWWGLDVSEHRTRQVGSEPLANVSLVLGFEQSHVEHAVVDAGAPRQKSFTLRELVGLLEDVSPLSSQDPLERARDAVEHTSALRDVAPASRSGLSMPDPFGGSWKTYCKTAEEIRTLAIILVSSLFGVSDAGSLPSLPPELSRAAAGLGRSGS